MCCTDTRSMEAEAGTMSLLPRLRERAPDITQVYLVKWGFQAMCLGPPKSSHFGTPFCPPSRGNEAPWT